MRSRCDRSERTNLAKSASTWLAVLGAVIVVFVVTSAVGRDAVSGSSTKLHVLEALLTDEHGDPVDGRVPVVVTLFDQEVGGLTLLTDDHSPGTPVPVDNGRIRVGIGSGQVTPGAVRNCGAAFAVLETVWAEVRISGQTLEPRIPVTLAAEGAPSSRQGSFTPRAEPLAASKGFRLYATDSTSSGAIALERWTYESGDAAPPEADPDTLAGGAGEPPGIWSWRQKEFLDVRRLPYEQIPAGVMTRAREQRKALPGPESVETTAQLQTVPGDRWFFVGPASFLSREGIVMSGRIRSLAVHPWTPSTIYVGSSGGGVWKTTDGGTLWEPMSDREASLSIGSLALDPQNPDIVYAGTGELGGDFYGAGLLRSFDGGESWTHLGAAEFDAPNGGAKIAKVALDPRFVSAPRTQRTLHVASSEGLWRSTDSGVTWTRAIGGIFSDLVVDPNDPDIVYAAKRGDATNHPSSGIYRSALAGALGSWTQVANSGGEFPSSQFGRINLTMTMDPGTSSSILYAIVEDLYFWGQLKGIWKSTDGGTSWTRLAGHPPAFAEGQWVVVGVCQFGQLDPVICESEPNDTFASADTVALGQVVDAAIDVLGDEDFYRVTITGDLLNVELQAQRAGSPVVGVVELFDAAGDPVLYKGQPRVGKNLPGTTDKRLGMEGWFTIPPGTYYVKVSSQNDAAAGPYQLSFTGIDTGCQCGWDQVIAVETNNPYVLYSGQVRMFRSVDGGVNWTNIQSHGGTNATHVDIQAAAFDPYDPAIMWWATDGGLFKTVDRGDHWESKNTNLGTVQPYAGISQHPVRDDFLLIGTQDNGCLQGDRGSWSEVLHGDGSFTAIVDSDTWWVSSFNLGLYKKTPAFPGPQFVFDHDFRVGTGKEAPFALAPHDSQVVIAGGGRALNPGTEHIVFRTDNGAQGGGQDWAANSQNLTQRILSLAFAPSDPDSKIYYAGTTGGELWRTRNSGATDWEELTWTGRSLKSIVDLAVHPTDPYTVFLAYSGFADPQVVRVTRPAAGPTTAVSISEAPYSSDPLPDLPVNAILVDPNHPSTIFVGTDYGVYRTVNGGVNWTTFDQGLPLNLVKDLILSPTTGPDGRLRAAIYGRGVWELRRGNDACSNATIVGDGSHTGDTSGTTQDGDSACDWAVNHPPRDVWFRYTATCDGELSLDTCGSLFDTVLSVYPDTCPGTVGTEIDCADDCSTGASCPRGGSCLTVDVDAGQNYLIRLAGADGDYGRFALNLMCRVPGDFCDEAIPLGLPDQVQGGTTGAYSDVAPVCDGYPVSAPGVWHTVVGNGNVLKASLCNAGTNYDTMLSVYCSGCTDSSCVAADDDSCGVGSEVTWCSTPGAIYHLLVHGFGGDTGSYDLSVTDQGTYCGPLYDFCGPANNTCSQALEIGGIGVRGDNTGATTMAGASCVASNSDVWYRFTPACEGFVTYDTCTEDGSLTDTVLSVWDECAGVELACNDDASGCATRSRVTVVAEADVPQAIRVAGFGVAENQGSFVLDVDGTPTPLILPEPGFYAVDGELTYEDWLVRLNVLDRAIEFVGPLNASGVAALAYAPKLGLMYAADDATDQMVTVDLDTGEALAYSSTGFASVRGLAYDTHRNILYGVDNDTDQLLRFHPYGDPATAIGPLGFAGVQGLAYDPDSDRLFGSDVATDQLIVIDRETGAATPVGPFGGDFFQVDGLTWVSLNRSLYGIHRHEGSGDGVIVRIDTETGQATQVGPTYTSAGADAIEYVPGLPLAVAGMEYSASIPVAGGCPVFRFSDYTGLPEGLAADEYGKIAGVTQEVGTFDIGFTLRDSTVGPPPRSESAPLRVRPHNDSCGRQLELQDGTWPFSTVNAFSNGPDEPLACGEITPRIGSDIWYCYEATCSGDLNVDLCSSTYDNMLAVYEGCECPREPSAVACTNDTCGLQAQLTTGVVAGHRYAVRVGGFDDNQGEGLITVECRGRPGGTCCLPGSCLVVDEADCLERGGNWIGEGEPCGQDPDGDGVADPCDGCPEDVLKAAPGICGCGASEIDTDGDGEPDCIDEDDDGDGVGDPEDASSQDRFRCGDTDGDGCEDCASGSYDPADDGEDADGDGWCVVADCDDGWPHTHPGALEVNDGVDNQCPGDPGHGVADEISGKLVFHDKNELAWLPQDGAAEYQVARSPDREFTGGCFLWIALDPVWIDPVEVEPGVVFHYLVRPVAPHIGSWGQDSSGNERSAVCL